ncbi:uncharacterized protein M6B38_358810 [Iris pallida]|uniref:Uncharacterized protein n=1 Tax=Iris pallida TaxID=29817 RepID=A0AAX6GJN1_IRIPA|nr:uncharacterized protein M6B38_358810 [Iris pallida]
MPKSSPSPTITPMNPKPPPPQTLTLTHPLADDHHHFLHSYHRSLFMVDDDPSSSAAAPLIFPQVDEEEDDDEEEEEEEEEEDGDRKPLNPNPTPSLLLLPAVDPTPHLSSQFYTFNRDSHSLMARCILESRLAAPDEIRAATPHPVLASWRSVWKDRNEDTAYLTAWKRIQDKLQAHLDPSTSVPHLYFKNNPSQRVPHVAQWHDIVARAHADPDLLRHLALKETVDRIRQSWTVGAKLYGIPESFVRVCVSSCPVCSGPAAAARSKRRRFEYTESMEVPARDVPRRLQQLAAKHQVVLCIRQKYIRYKPFMAEVKDYACHRAGEPSSGSGSSAKKARMLKREPYQSKRCGCGFRIRAIVPITNYNEKDKTFVYKEEGNAVFKLYAVHSGHEPGPLDGNARIIHRMVGNKGRFDVDPVIYGVREEDTEPVSYVNLMAKDNGGGDANLNVILQQVQDLRIEAELMEGKIARMPQEVLGQISCELAGILNRLRSIGGPQHLEEATLVMDDNEVGQWRDDGNQNHHLDGHDTRMFVKDPEIIEEEENDFGLALGTIVPWGRMETECHGRKMLIPESCKPDDKWLKEDCGDFDEKIILNCGDEEDSKLIKPMRHDVTIVSDSNLVGIQVDGFYHDSTKWYDSPGSLDSVVDSGDGGFRHGGLP